MVIVHPENGYWVREWVEDGVVIASETSENLMDLLDNTVDIITNIE